LKITSEIYYSAMGLFADILLIISIVCLALWLFTDINIIGFMNTHSRWITLNYIVIIIIMYCPPPYIGGWIKLKKFKVENPYLPTYFPHEIKKKGKYSVLIDGFAYANNITIIVRTDGIIFSLLPPFGWIISPFLIKWKNIVPIPGITTIDHNYRPLVSLFIKKQKQKYVKLDIKDAPDVDLLLPQEFYKDADIENYIANASKGETRDV
jgi:hypothetical protein